MIRKRRPTPAQHRLLAAAARRPGGRLVGGDPRTRQILVDYKWVELDGECYGSLFRITPAGRLAAGVAP